MLIWFMLIKPDCSFVGGIVKIYKKLSPFLALLLITGCSTIPKPLQTADEAFLVNYQQAKSEQNANVGLPARWGGIIAKVENLPTSTRIEVVNLDLSSSTRPINKQETLGRFRLYYDGLLDPVIYKQGKSITAIGEIAQIEAGKIGEADYQFPVLKAKKVHLWKDIQKVDIRVTHQPFWYMPPYYGYHSPYSRRVVVTKSGGAKNKVNKGQQKNK